MLRKPISGGGCRWSRLNVDERLLQYSCAMLCLSLSAEKHLRLICVSRFDSLNDGLASDDGVEHDNIRAITRRNGAI